MFTLCLIIVFFLFIMLYVFYYYHFFGEIKMYILTMNYFSHTTQKLWTMPDVRRASKIMLAK